MARLSKQSAIFLDRDGLINRDRPDYVKRWEEFEFVPRHSGGAGRVGDRAAPTSLRSLTVLDVPVN